MQFEPRKLGIFRLGHIGDTIIALPALWTVRKRFPNARITYLSQQHDLGALAQGLEVLRTGMVFDDRLGYDLGTGGVSLPQILKTLIALRTKQLDTLVYLPPFRTQVQLNRDAKFFRLAGIKQIIGMDGYRETLYRPEGTPLPAVRHEADTLLSHLHRDGVFLEESPLDLMDMGLTAAERKHASAWLAAKMPPEPSLRIGVGPGSKMPAKRWDLERFVAAVQELDSRLRVTFVLFGSPAEAEDCAEIARAARHAVSTVGELSVRQSAAVLEQCDCYLGNDTGTMHLAAAVKTPCVAVFSARDWPGRWYPYGPGHVVHRVAVACEGCMLEVCDKDNLCLKEIGVAQVVQSVLNVLGSMALERR